jgi:hypothetical protein
MLDGFSRRTQAIGREKVYRAKCALIEHAKSTAWRRATFPGNSGRMHRPTSRGSITTLMTSGDEMRVAKNFHRRTTL